MQRRHCAYRAKAGRFQFAREHIAKDIADVTGPGVGLAALDARFVPIDAYDLGDSALTKGAGEFAIAAPDIHGSLTSRRNGLEL
jgi:hypothetical protein